MFTAIKATPSILIAWMGLSACTTTNTVNGTATDAGSDGGIIDAGGGLTDGGLTDGGLTDGGRTDGGLGDGGGLSDGGLANCPVVAPTFTAIYTGLLASPTCTACHFGLLPQAGLSFGLSQNMVYAELINVPSSGNPNIKLVVPNSYTTSLLWSKIHDTMPLVGAQMPRGFANPPNVVTCESTQIQNWIQGGALNN